MSPNALIRRARLGGVALLSAVAAATMISACGTSPVRLSLNTGSVSACYRGLPAARAALHEDQAKLKGVHRMPVDKLARTFPGLTLPAGDDDTEVCTFSFEGTFLPGQVNGAPTVAQGPYAVVIVSSKHLTLVASYVGELPKEDHGAAKGLPHSSTS